MIQFWRTQLLTGAVVVAAASVERRVERPQKPREGPWRKGQNPNDGLEKCTCVYIHISESVYMHTYIQTMYSLFVFFQGFVHGTTRKDDTCLSFLVASWLSLAICGQLTIGTDEWHFLHFTPLKIHMKPKTYLIEKENNLPNLIFWVPCQFFQGVLFVWHDSMIFIVLFTVCCVAWNIEGRGCPCSRFKRWC